MLTLSQLTEMYWFLLCSSSFYNFARIFATIEGGERRTNCERSSLWNGNSSHCHWECFLNSQASSFRATVSPRKKIIFMKVELPSIGLTSLTKVMILKAGGIVCYLDFAGTERGKQSQPDCFRFGLVCV